MSNQKSELESEPKKESDISDQKSTPSLSNNQEVALYVANHTDVANITIQRARLIAEAII